MSDGVERDPKGKFLPGHQAKGGRPRGIDFRRMVTERCEREGMTAEDAVWAIFRSLMKSAQDGDTGAAKFLIERMCGPADPGKRLTVEIDGDATERAGPIVPTDQREFAERCAEAVRELKLLA